MTQGIVMLLLGVAVARIVSQGAYLNYVKPSLTIPLMLAAAVLVVVALAEIWRSTARDEVKAHQPTGASGPSEGASGVEEAAHDHSHGSRVAWLLLIPLFALYLIPPAALGADAAERSNTFAPQAAEAAESSYPPLPEGDPTELTLIEYSNRAVYDQGATLAGRQVALTGFVTQRPEQGWYVTRMAVGCCAADALAVKVVVTGDDASAWPDDTWVTVMGRYAGEEERQGNEPEGLAAIEVDSVQRTEQPADPYEGQVF